MGADCNQRQCAECGWGVYDELLHRSRGGVAVRWTVTFEHTNRAFPTKVVQLVSTEES